MKKSLVIKYSNIPKGNFMRKLVSRDDKRQNAVLISSDYVNELKSVEKGEDRVAYFNSNKFIKSIDNIVYFSYNPATNTIKFLSNDSSEILRELSQEFPGVTFVRKISSCDLNLRISAESITKLREIANSPREPDKNSQVEMGGKLTAKKGLDNVYTLHLNSRSVYKGEEEGIEMLGGSYNFHTHPKDAYVRNNVNVGWPSPTDYNGFLISWDQMGTIVHIVVSIEGLYVISLNSEWDGVVTDKLLDKVEKQCIYKRDIRNIPKYVKKIESVTDFKKGRIFKVKYLPWDESSEVFSVSYPRKGKVCITPLE